MSKPILSPQLEAIEAAKNQLYNLMYEAYEIIRVAVLLSHDDVELQRLVPRQQSLLAELGVWHKSFILECDRTESSDVAWITSNMLVYWNVCHIWLSTCTVPLQTAFDNHFDGFAAVIDHADRVVRLKVNGRPFAAFEMPHEMEVMSPLCFTATRCRDPTLRRKALRLMRQAPEAQTFSASLPNRRVIERVIAIEEGRNNLMTSNPHEESIELPLESQRIHHIAVVRQGLVQSQEASVQLSKFKHNPDGSRVMVQETIWLDP
jgi:hypothetical protein